jgi:lipopolysaccharide export system protein LptA
MTLNEVNIIKNSVLDATEAYVDARLSIADFAKTQIGVTEGTPTPIHGKFYHTVVCNATSNTAGVTYHNVLSVGNTPFPDGSVVFLIAPNAQFSNQFILGKLDDTPVHITGGTIDIGDGNFAVDKNGNVTIKKGSINLGNGSFIVDNEGNVTIKKGSISLGATTIGGVSTYNFIVTNQGVVYIRDGSINLGYKNGVQDYNFKVDTNGINLGVTGTTPATKSYNFTVTNAGKVTIKDGEIKLGYTTDSHISNGTYNFIVDSNGIKSGAYPYQSGSYWYWRHYFNLANTGTLTVGNNFSVNYDGTVAIKSGYIQLANKLKIDSNGWLAVGGIDSNAPFYVDNGGNVKIRQGTINIGNGQFVVDANGNLTTKYIVANTGGEIAGFTIHNDKLTTNDNETSGNTNAKAELSSTTVRVSRWTGSSDGRRISAILDVSGTGRLVLNGDNANDPYIAVSSKKGWEDNGSFSNPLSSSANYFKLSPTALTVKESEETAYTCGTPCFKFLSQSQTHGDIGNLRIDLGNDVIIFRNINSNKSRSFALT